MSLPSDAAARIEKLRDRASRKQRRRRRRWLAIGLWFLVQARWGWPSIVPPLLEVSGFSGWDAEPTVDSPDGELQAIAQSGDQGALGWGPRRVVVQRAGAPASAEVVIVVPHRGFALEPCWIDARRVEVIVRADREATAAELADGKRSLDVAGDLVEVVITWKEWGQP